MCSRCIPGTIQPAEGSESCMKCEAGYAQEGSGQISCNICPEGTFSTEGASDCKKCKDQDSRTVAPYQGTEKCSPCPEGAYADSTGTRCLCEVGLALVSEGCSANETSFDFCCKACPKGAVCNERGLLMEALVSEPGWYKQGQNFQQCLLKSHCLGESKCADNRATGPNGTFLCAVCANKFTEDFDGDCVACSSESNNTVFMILVAIVCLVALGLMYFFMLYNNRHLFQAAVAEDKVRQQRSEGVINDEVHEFEETHRYQNFLSIYGPPPPKPNFIFKGKIFLGFVQVVVNLIFSIDIGWPWGFKSFLQSFNFVNLDFFAGASVNCVIARERYYYMKLWGAAALPIVAVVGLVIFFVVPQYIINCSKSERSRSEN